jgi:hypothetical protein
VYSATSQTLQTAPTTSASTLVCPTRNDLQLQLGSRLVEDPASHSYTIYLNITLANTLHNQLTITGVNVGLLNVTFPNGTVLPTNETSSGGDPRILNPGQWTSIDFKFVSGVRIKSASFDFVIYIQGCHTISLSYEANLP